jgi:hypothetical protein
MSTTRKLKKSAGAIIYKIRKTPYSKRKSLSPKRKSRSPKRKSSSPKRKSRSPKRKSLSPKRKSRSPKRKSHAPYAEWRKLSPKRGKERNIMYAKCGEKCFLGPNKSFPICNRGTCKINAKGIYAAYVRAREWHYKIPK